MGGISEVWILGIWALVFSGVCLGLRCPFVSSSLQSSRELFRGSGNGGNRGKRWKNIKTMFVVNIFLGAHWRVPFFRQTWNPEAQMQKPLKITSLKRFKTRGYKRMLFGSPRKYLKTSKQHTKLKLLECETIKLQPYFCCEGKSEQCLYECFLTAQILSRKILCHTRGL